VPSLPPPAILVFPAAIVGLVMGSFVTALTYRQPRAESVAHGRSKCPACGHTLAAVDLVPVLSWVAQGGACRYCKAAISPRYPAIEFCTMAMFAAGAFFVSDLIHVILLAAMTVAMVALTVVDLERQRLPNSFLLVLAALSLAWRWTDDRELLLGLVAAAIVFAVGVMLNAGYRAVTGRAGLGFGDTKLLAVAALALPVGPLLIFLLSAGVLGVGFGLLWRWGKATAHFPFGPAILAAYWGCLVAGNSAFAGLVSRFS
jgi:leader peptidase (prepilin peptidase)/N-methyltransferase